MEERCPGEPYLNRKEQLSTGFQLDLHFSLQQVHEGICSKVAAIENLSCQEIRPFSKSITGELNNCIDKIVAGECRLYLKKLAL